MTVSRSNPKLLLLGALFWEDSGFLGYIIFTMHYFFECVHLVDM